MLSKNDEFIAKATYLHLQVRDFLSQIDKLMSDAYFSSKLAINVQNINSTHSLRLERLHLLNQRKE